MSPKRKLILGDPLSADEVDGILSNTTDPTRRASDAERLEGASSITEVMLGDSSLLTGVENVRLFLKDGGLLVVKNGRLETKTKQFGKAAAALVRQIRGFLAQGFDMIGNQSEGSVAIMKLAEGANQKEINDFFAQLPKGSLIKDGHGNQYAINWHYKNSLSLIREDGKKCVTRITPPYEVVERIEEEMQVDLSADFPTPEVLREGLKPGMCIEFEEDGIKKRGLILGAVEENGYFEYSLLDHEGEGRSSSAHIDCISNIHLLGTVDSLEGIYYSTYCRSDFESYQSFMANIEYGEEIVLNFLGYYPTYWTVGQAPEGGRLDYYWGTPGVSLDKDREEIEEIYELPCNKSRFETSGKIHILRVEELYRRMKSVRNITNQKKC